MCWFEDGITNSLGRPAPAAGLGFLPGSNSVHYDGEPERRPAYLEAVAAGALPAGYGVDDGVGLLFRGTRLAEVVASRARRARLPRRRPPTAAPTSTSSSRACWRAARTSSPAPCRTTSASCGCSMRRAGRCATASCDGGETTSGPCTGHG